MDLNEFQKKVVKLIDEIDSKHEGNHDNETTFIHIMEEFGEIARQIYNEKYGRDKIDIDNLKGEIADVYALLAKLADNFNINLEEAIKDKIKVLEERHNLD